MIETIHNSVFYEKPEVVSSAPGKINLMGEHTQRNGGFVFSIGVNRRVYVSISSRADEKFLVYFDRDIAIESFTKKSLSKISKGERSAPVKGIIKSFLDNGFDVSGLNICIATDIPASVDLGDLSATIVALSFGIRHLQNFNIEDIDLIQLCEKANKYLPHFYVNVFDCIASAMARDNAGVFIDCRTFKYEYAPISKGLKILIIDPGEKDIYAVDDFLKREKECKEALDVISSVNPKINSLRDLTLDEIPKYSNFLEKNSINRIKYIVGENERTLNFVVALRRRNFSMLGKLMFDSHFSLRNDYEMSSDEIDAIVDISATIDGVVGAKIYGVRSGVVALALKEKAGEAIRVISEEFQKLFGRKVKIYVTSPENGVEVSSRG